MEQEFEILKRNRQELTRIVSKVSVEEINHIPKGHNNNILWNMAHIVSVQESITYGLSGLRWTAPKEIIKPYARGTVPTDVKDEQFVEEVVKELLTGIDRLEDNYNRGVFKEYKPYKVQTGYEMCTVEDAIKFDIFHEGLHVGYVMSILGKLK